MSSALSAYAQVAARAAREAGALLARHIGKPKTVQTKRSRIDLVTEIDRASERLIHTVLHRATPTFGFLGEEQGERYARTTSRWIVDPLDGTNNFVHGLPLFGVSIGLEHHGKLVVGVVYDPIRRELFIATKGGGCTLNGARVHVSPTKTIAHSLLSTGFSSQFLTRTQPYLRWFKAFQRQSHGVRRIGSTVLSLAWVACGRLEGFYERDLWPWDVAAGMVLVQEAGGRVSNLDGGLASVADGRLVASNGRIHREMLHILSSSGRGKRS